jgi:hypothetical protein
MVKHIKLAMSVEWNAIQLEICAGCEWKWFDLDVRQMEDGAGLCKECRKSTPLYHNNNMSLGLACPGLPSLIQIEEMLILPVALTQVGY